MSGSPHRRTKSNWFRPSLNPLRPKDGQQSARPKAPWEVDESEMREEQMRSLEAQHVEVTHPWDEGSVAAEVRERELEKAANYRYESMFEVPEMSEERKKQLADYKMNPPFNVGYNEEEEKSKAARKLDPKRNPKTRQPWAYGSMPAEPVHRKIHEKPSTSLWSVPQGDQTANARPALVTSGDPILDSLREQLHKHGASGIQGLARKFRILDDDGSGTLDQNEFCKGMKECKVVDLSDRAIQHLFRYFDKDDSGTISYDEFLVGIRGVMNERRRGLVKLAFHVLDTDGSGAVDLQDMRQAYNARSHPDVIAERRTEDEVLQEFLETFTATRGRAKHSTARGAAPSKPTSQFTISFDDFCDYYANISASVDSDDYFELLIRNAWHISGGQGQYANTTNRRILVTHADGRQTVEEVQNDIRISAKDTDKMMQQLEAQGMKDIANINLTGIDDMKHQVENPRSVQWRQYQEQQAQQMQQPQQQQQQQQRQQTTQAPRSAYPAPSPRSQQPQQQQLSSSAASLQAQPAPAVGQRPYTAAPVAAAAAARGGAVAAPGVVCLAALAAGPPSQSQSQSQPGPAPQGRGPIASLAALAQNMQRPQSQAQFRR